MARVLVFQYSPGNINSNAEMVIFKESEAMGLCQRRADQLAKPMFFLSLLFVLLAAVLLVPSIDIPSVSRISYDTSIDFTARSSILSSGESQTNVIGVIAIVLLIAIWPLFCLEYCLASASDKKPLPIYRRRSLREAACIIPPLRLAAGSPAMDGKVWLPGLGWRRPGKRLGVELEKIFTRRMLLIALLILPVLVIEFGLAALVAEQLWLRILLHIVTGIIWCAFTVEFIIMICVTDQKINYVKTHWVDVVVILLPMAAFLRSWHLLQTFRVVNIHSLVRMGRIYQMRGLLIRAAKMIMVVRFSNRNKPVSPSSRLVKLKREYSESRVKLEALREEIIQTEFEISKFAKFDVHRQET